MKAVKKIFLFITLIAIYFVGKEFLSLYFLISNASYELGIAFIVLSVIVVIYFAIVPAVQIYKMGKFDLPTKDTSKIEELRGKRIERFKKNPYLLEQGEIDLAALKNTEEDYERVIAVLSRRADEILRERVNAIFYSTGISQNGFIDGLFMLGASFNLIKEIFILYNGRVDNLALLGIIKKIYFAVLVAGTEGVEYASNEIFSKLTPNLIKKVPFLGGIITSVIDGFVNAALLTRIGLVAENYCKTLYIEKEKDLVPTTQVVVITAKKLTSKSLESVSERLKELANTNIEKIKNPLLEVFSKAKEFGETTSRKIWRK